MHQANMSCQSKSALLEKATLYLYNGGLRQLQLKNDQGSQSEHTGMSNFAEKWLP